MNHRHSYTPLNVPHSMSGSIEANSLSLLRVSPSFYKRIYFLLRAQHTIVNSIDRSLAEFHLEPGTPDYVAVQTYMKVISDLNKSDYANLLQIAFTSVQDIKMALAKTLSPQVDKVGYSLLSAVLSISRLIDIFSFTCSSMGNEHIPYESIVDKKPVQQRSKTMLRRPSDASILDHSKPLQITSSQSFITSSVLVQSSQSQQPVENSNLIECLQENPEQEEKQDQFKTQSDSKRLSRKLQKTSNTGSSPTVGIETEYIICRICDKKVPLCLIETHSKNCALAYESSKTMSSTDDRMTKLQALARQTILRKKWPGDEQFTNAVILPILHVVILLDRAICIDMDSNLIDAATELDIIADAMMSITMDMFFPEGSSIINKANTLLSNKLNATDSFSRALDVVRRTSINVSEERFFLPLVNNNMELDHDDDITLENENLLLTQVKREKKYQMGTTTIADFKFIKRISSGAYARVYLGKKNKTGDIYAIKVIPKTGLRQKNEVQRVKIEKDILMKTYSPFMIRFFYSFIGEHNLYLVMEYLPGGDLYSVLQANGSIDEESSLVYTVQIVLALQFLRENQIIHRDLKPDNILVDSEGHLKLIDFGLSYFGMVDRSLSFNGGSSLLTVTDSCVGTPDYTSPEIILSQPHTFTADYFSLGCILYEFLVGIPPFHGQTPSETFQKVVKGHYDSESLEDNSEEVQDLISRLLCPDPKRRIGANSIDEIKNHPWFAGVDWNKIEMLPKPFVPQLCGKEDTSYFEDRTFSLGQKTDEKDIIDDIRLCKSDEDKKRSRSSSIMSIIVDDDSADASNNDSAIIEDEMKNFQSISIHQLQETTNEEARIRRKNLPATSLQMDENEFHAQTINNITHKKEKKKRSSRRRLPRKSYMPGKNNGVSSPINHQVDDSCDDDLFL
ncbi:Microtubule-associated serine/threonine-protein kinase 2 [Tritrichomonas musculus]|uniref:non-specific serine/threonine protein kinase n=1 Tax=Tritrichomonas musculus TaxID=1915356 RepID=A0ABR2HFC9_9EUKA